MKKMSIFLVLVALSFSNINAKESEYVLRFSHVTCPDSPKGKAALFFEKRLEELSKGKIDVMIFPNSELYDDRSALTAIALDNVQMVAPSFAKFKDVVTGLSIFDLPFLFRDIEHVNRILDSEIGQAFKNQVKKEDYIVLDYWDNGFKIFTSNKKPIVKYNDLKNQKIRVMSSDVLVSFFKTAKAKPKVMTFHSVYENLKNGKIDAQENTASNIVSKKFHTVQKYLTVSNHSYLGYLVVVSKDFYESLPKNLQSALNQAMREATKKERAWAKELNKSNLDKLKKYASEHKEFKIYELDKSFATQAQKSYDKMCTDLNKDLIKQIKAMK